MDAYETYHELKYKYAGDHSKFCEEVEKMKNSFHNPEFVLASHQIPPPQLPDLKVPTFDFVMDKPGGQDTFDWVMQDSVESPPPKPLVEEFSSPYASMINKWYMEAGLGPASLQLQALSAQDACIEFFPKTFDVHMTYMDWLNHASQTWSHPHDWIMKNHEMYHAMQPFLKDFKINFIRVKGNPQVRKAKLVNMVKAFIPCIIKLNKHDDNMPTFAPIKGSVWELLKQLHSFPLADEAAMIMLYRLPAGIDYVVHLFVAICVSIMNRSY